MTILPFPPTYVHPVTSALDEDERKALASVMPPLPEALTPNQRMAKANVFNALSDLGNTMMEKAKARQEEIKELDKKRVAEITRLTTERDGLRIQLQQVQAELHAAQEMRGIYENKKLTALQKDITAKESVIVDASIKTTELTNLLDATRNELAGRVASCAGYEHDISMLMKASIANAANLDQAHAYLTTAINAISDRYGANASTFLNAIRTNIAAALAKLPAPAKPKEKTA